MGQSAKVEKEVAVRLEKAGKVYQGEGKSSGAVTWQGQQNVSFPDNANVCPSVWCRDLASDAT